MKGYGIFFINTAFRENYHLDYEFLEAVSQTKIQKLDKWYTETDPKIRTGFRQWGIGLYYGRIVFPENNLILRLISRSGQQELSRLISKFASDIAPVTETEIIGYVFVVSCLELMNPAKSLKDSYSYFEHVKDEISRFRQLSLNQKFVVALVNHELDGALSEEVIRKRIGLHIEEVTVLVDSPTPNQQLAKFLSYFVISEDIKVMVSKLYVL